MKQSISEKEVVEAVKTLASAIKNSFGYSPTEPSPFELLGMALSRKNEASVSRSIQDLATCVSTSIDLVEGAIDRHGDSVETAARTLADAIRYLANSIPKE